MTNAGFAFHRNGNVTFTDGQSGEVYTLYAPKLGAMRQIEEYGSELAEAHDIPAIRERLDEVTREIAAGRRAVEAAKESGSEADVEEAEAAYADLLARVDDENEKLARDLVDKTREQSLAWFIRVVQLCGSDNWPRIIDKGTGEPMKDEHGHDRIDTDELPHVVRASQLVADIKAHWWSVPLAESPNGASQATTLTPTSQTP